ncbi:predicted protein [Chaetomium globosum CBS 148.51]|uniref:Uncharacterized protein n=1 Tax=Chaetomium globosum (strain ATCC 6205 / CBS 148.51 / DSM 1962 / NBRC 6347 / NRRL 1970) TaxID=306901 RepID=Q2HI33_CHAGB|nr:uncharacterized protein CHGG_00121 [Chaetomium globosum CBS 148.51]EAQ91886.1 predicted protein [Chaetomium globosum CBS 148.51]
MARALALPSVEIKDVWVDLCGPEIAFLLLPQPNSCCCFRFCPSWYIRSGLSPVAVLASLSGPRWASLEEAPIQEMIPGTGKSDSTSASATCGLYPAEDTPKALFRLSKSFFLRVVVEWYLQEDNGGNWTKTVPFDFEPHHIISSHGFRNFTAMASPLFHGGVYIHYDRTDALRSGVGELLAVSECLHAASQELARHADSPMLAGKTVVVRIFNDNRSNLEFLQGTRSISASLFATAAPVLRSIVQQSHAIHHHSVDVRLELHWIPGHHRTVKPHALTDQLARTARKSRRALTTIPPRYWVGPEEGPMFRSLKAELYRASRTALWYTPDVWKRFFRWPCPPPVLPDPRALS